MPDITMCRNEQCKKKMQCFRYTAKPSQIQAFSDFANECNELNGYKRMIEAKSKSQYKRMETITADE